MIPSFNKMRTMWIGSDRRRCPAGELEALDVEMSKATSKPLASAPVTL
jgi:hypothetical protein